MGGEPKPQGLPVGNGVNADWKLARLAENVLALALTLMVKSSLPSRPRSARALNPVLN